MARPPNRCVPEPKNLGLLGKEKSLQRGGDPRGKKVTGTSVRGIRGHKRAGTSPPAKVS